MRTVAKTKPRRRLEAAAAREIILDAAEKRLVVVGPSGIRLQEVAADAGVSHPTVLHHFGSREGLVQAVISRALRAITATLVETIAASSGDEGQFEEILENVAVSLERTGYARVILWLLLEGHPMGAPESSLREVVDATHALRLRRSSGGKKPKREDTARAIVLAAMALIGGSVLAPSLLENAGLESDARTITPFRRWLAGLLRAHLDGEGM